MTTTIHRPRRWRGALAALQDADQAGSTCFWCGHALRQCPLDGSCPGSSTVTARPLCTRCCLQLCCPRHGKDWHAF